MELFTLGEGHYSEQDIKEAARAFTGWSVDRDTRRIHCSGAASHDDGDKTVLGTQRQFRRRRGARSCCWRSRRPRSSSSRKLWREFVSPHAGCRRGASASPASFRDSALQHRGRCCARCCCPTRSTRRRTARALIKSPVDLVVGTMRTFDDRARRPAPVRAGLRAARPESVRAAQREGLARRRGVDQHRDAARRASSCSTAVPRARRCRRRRHAMADEGAVHAARHAVARRTPAHGRVAWLDIAFRQRALARRSFSRRDAAMTSVVLRDAAADRRRQAPRGLGRWRAGARPGLSTEVSGDHEPPRISCALRRAAAVSLAPAPARGPRARRYRQLLVLVELKGGNDGLNTVVPYADPALCGAAPAPRDRARPGAATRRTPGCIRRCSR